MTHASSIFDTLVACARNLPSLPPGSSYSFTDRALEEVGQIPSSIPWPMCSYQVIRSAPDGVFTIIRLPD